MIILSGSSVHGDSPGKNTGVGCHTLVLQGIFQTQGSNPGLLSPAVAGGFFTTNTTQDAWKDSSAERKLTVFFRGSKIPSRNKSSSFTVSCLWILGACVVLCESISPVKRLESPQRLPSWPLSLPSDSPFNDGSNRFSFSHKQLASLLCMLLTLLCTGSKSFSVPL